MRNSSTVRAECQGQLSLDDALASMTCFEHANASPEPAGPDSASKGGSLEAGDGGGRRESDVQLPGAALTGYPG
jgi:hypothetical protein